MMRRSLVSALALGMVASIGMAGPVLYEIAPVDTATASFGRAITPDGKYVAVGSTDGGSASTTGLGGIWDATNGIRQVKDVPGNLSFSASGIGYRTVNGSQQVVIHAGASGPRDCYWFSADSGSTWTRFKPGTTTTFSSGIANTLAGSSTDTVYGVYSSTATNFYGMKISGDPVTAVASTKGTSSDTTVMNGVSNASPAAGKVFRAVGVRGSKNYIADYDGTTASPATFFPNGLRAAPNNQQGQLSAVSLDGTVAGGMSPVDAPRTGNWPFIVTGMTGTDTGTATELPTFNPAAANATNGIVYGLSANGRYAVGMDYTRGYELAVLWDRNTSEEIDLTQFAADNGILGGFTNNLRRAYSVGVNGDGYPVVTGWGVTNTLATRGFVLTIPEPATACLVILGGLALLRRR